MKIGFKITDPDMRSAIVTNEAQVQYKLGKFTSHKFGYGPLLLFEDFNGALNYIKEELRNGGDQSYMRMFACKYKPSRKKQVWDDKLFKAFGSSLKMMKKIYPGTVFAKKIMPLIEIPISSVSALALAQSKKRDR